MCGGKKGCQKPEELKGKPEDCSPEQIRKCHGEVSEHPCIPSADCEKPENLKGQPADCSPEQIKACHGDVGAHPCERTG